MCSSDLLRAGSVRPARPSPSRDEIPGVNSVSLGAGTVAGHIYSSTRSGLKFIGREPGRLDYVAWDLGNRGYPGFF